ncbi:unnamed protein product [Ophioblennius macclurei]
MWTVFIFLISWGLLLTASASPPHPVNVSFSSVNLRNVLHWVPGTDTPDDTLFTVEYAIYGDSVETNKGRRVRWRKVNACQEIVRTWCDLSKETEDEEQGYHARVRAVSRRAASKWVLTLRRFDPKVETTFGPPLVSVEIENNSAIVTLKGPMRYMSRNRSSVHSMAEIYPQMTYNLSINNTYRNQVHHVPVLVSPHKYRQLEYNTRYCFSAESRFLSMPIPCQRSAWQCIVTPQDPLVEQLQKVIVSIVVPGLCLGFIAVAGYLLHKYLTGKGQKSPHILNEPYLHPAPVTFPPENPKNNIVSVITNEFPTEPVSIASHPECPGGQQCVAEPPPAYSPQRLGAHPEEAQDDFPVDYGFVAPAINEEEDGERERRLDDGNAGGSSHPRSWLGFVGGRFPTASPLQKSYQAQNVLRTCRETHTQVDLQAEINARDHISARSQMNSTFLTQASVPSVAFQGSAVQGPFSNKSIDEREGHQPERQPLLSAYASQNIQNRSTVQAAHSDYLPDDYGVVVSSVRQEETEEDDYGYEEDGERVCVDWDPETGKLVLPAFSNERRVDGFGVPEEEMRIAEEDGVEPYSMKGGLRLENVFVRQGSSEVEEGQRELEEGRAAGWEVDDFLSTWNLKISMDE